MNNLQNRDKQTRFSIRKYSVGVFSVSVATLYFLAGGNALAANDNAPRVSETSSGAPGNSTDPETTPKEKENNETLATNNTKPVENKEALNAAQRAEASTSANTRGRRVRRDTGDAPTGETSGNSTGTETPTGASTENNEALNSALTERKGSTVQPDQPGISIPTGNESGAHDPNAHISFDDPGHNATVEEMWKIIQHMPDDFQNNERSYLRNMDTLGRELRFDKTAENPEGVPLQPGEIRELHDFGGWHAVDENGNKGKFVIGRKNAQGYFTGWHKVGETSEGIPIMEQGGMLGADALDNIYVHEQALDRRFDYMLMLVKGRTRANRTETVADHSTYDPRTPNERSNLSNTEFNNLPFLEKDKFNKYSPGVVGYNGIEKKFTAFSTKYGSRVRVDFVTGYISDINGNKGSYRIVIKAQNSKGEETQVYDETISRVAEIVQNEELYKKGLNVEAAHTNILKFLKDEFNYRVNKIKNPKVKANSLLRGTKEKDYTPEQQKVYDQIVEEATEEAKKQGDIVMNVTEDFLSITKAGKKDSEWKKTFTNTAQSTAKLSNDLNNLLKNADKDTPNTPTWLNSGSSQAKADDRAYRLLTTLIPGAKKITYHVNDDQLEVETDKYTYTAARNGSKEVGIQGSNIAATLSADAYGANPQTFDRENTNTKANNLNHGWATSSSEEFKHFSRFLGVDKGIVRTNVISDEELSAKIKEAVGPGYSKLGKPGYFSTADIPLGTDIVSYTVQVIPSDNERVGVNSQSSRIQYNMPILADFSVIQDTTGPSKELARRIISKSNIPEDKKNKIIEEINKSKKTSEIRSAMSGNVKVRYVDKAGNVITNIENENTFGEKDSENRYTAAKDVLISSTYDVRARAYTTLSTTDNRYYSLVADNGGLAAGSASTTGTIDTTNEDKVVTFVYELTEKPVTPTTGKGVVHFKKQVSGTVTEPLTGYGDITLSGNVGETFSSTEVDTKITELKNAGYEIVTNEFDTNSKTIDSTTDEDGQDPSQVYNVIVREKVETVTTPPTPDTPVDPNIPDGPKWPESGLKESDLTKEVTRTITYVKKETADGEKIPDAQPTKVDKVLYKRTATYNLVSKTVTYSNWTPTADDTHTDTHFSPVKTPVLTGYVADFKEVTDAPAAPTANGDVTNMTKEVVYTKIGSWVPKIPGKTPTPILYPNDPEDATKPKYPDYPTTPENPDGTPNPQPDTPGTPEKPKTPELPVIPYEPGYTPGIPTDPTQPVDPNTNPLVPLTPVDPKDPKKGYKVPEIPEKPGNDTPITYEADPQKVLVKVFNTTTGTEVELPAEKVSIENGTPNTAIPTKSLEDKIKDLEKRGYTVDNKDLLKGKNFDTNKDVEGQDPSQVYKLLVRERTTTDTETKPVTRTIKYVKIDDSTGEEVEVENAQPTNTTTVNFTRNQTMNLVTGLTTNGKWSEKQTLGEVKTPVLEGYVADKATVEAAEVTGESQDIEEKVVYRKIGSWVPRLPEGVTPPEGTDMTPKPYPNNPNDPTKPTNPVYPTTPPQPGEPTPKVPVIPYVPGYTPKIPNDPTKPEDPNTNPLVPLKPVDPADPKKGYKVPPVPETPGKDTPIKYEADPQKVVVKVFNTTTGTEVELPTEKVSIENGTPNTAIPTKSLEDKIKDLEKRGYTVDNKDLLKGKNFDTNKDVEGQDPSQVYKLLVRERTTTDTETKPVTRTIKYVKIDDSTGEEVEVENAQPTNTTTVNFTRNQTMNLVTGLTTNGKWSEKQTLGEVKTPVLEGYVADKATVEAAEVTGESQDIEEKVVYRKIGSWVPRLPEGVTPPEGTDMTPKPYPNNPNDPTKPTNPVYPTTPPQPGEPTPKVPVIPYVPGYTPKTPDGTPLVPVDPNHPENGYKVPPVPETPGKDTPITYEKVPDKPQPETTGTKEVTRIIKYVDEKGNELAKPSTDKVTFKGNGSDWNAVDGDSTFDAVKSPVVKGYILKDPAQKVVEKETVKSDAKDETITVTYTKVGSFVPKVPEGVTPKTPLTPTPYDNDPEDPTKVVTPNPEKPQDPKDPNSPKVPVIPQVPGHTPVVPKDPTKPVSPENPLVPLTPVDPNHPEKGYNVPPVPTTPGQDTPITYVKDGQQRAIVNFVDENGNSVAASILQTGKAGDKFTKDTLVKATISELESKGYEVKTNDYPKEGTGVFDNDTKVDQIFTVTVRKIEVLPPTPRVIERPGGNTVVEVGVPNKDADTLNIWYTKRNNPNAPREEIVTKKDKDGTWKIEKAPEGVTVNPSTGIVSIPGNKIQPKTWIDTQTKHETKTSKIVSVMPNIHDLKEFVGTTEWIDVEGKVLKPSEEGIHEKGRFDNLVWLVTILEGNKITHIFGPGTPTVDKPEYKVTVWFDENGNPIKPDKPGTHESGKIPGYRFITTTTKDGVTVHKFEKITPVDPNKPTPENPTTPNPEKPGTPTPGSPTIPNAVPGKVTEKQQVKRLANTGETETNTGLAGLGLAMFGMALAAIKRRKDK